MRMTATGAHAEQLTAVELAFVRRASHSVALRRLPLFAVGAIILPRLRRDGPARRCVGEIARTIVALFNAEPDESTDLSRLHDAVRDMPDVALDVLDDLLRDARVATILEGERMWRARMLAEDWSLAFEEEPGQRPRLRVLVVMAAARAVC